MSYYASHIESETQETTTTIIAEVDDEEDTTRSEVFSTEETIRAYDEHEDQVFQAELDKTVTLTYGTVSRTEREIIKDMWQKQAELGWGIEEATRAASAEISDLESMILGELSDLRSELLGAMSANNSALRTELRTMVNDQFNRLIPSWVISNPVQFIQSVISGQWVWDLLERLLDGLAGEFYKTHPLGER